MDKAEQAVHEEFDRLRGRLAGFLEACGLPDRQERGAIQTLKALSYDAEKRIVELIEQ